MQTSYGTATVRCKVYGDRSTIRSHRVSQRNVLSHHSNYRPRATPMGVVARTCARRVPRSAARKKLDASIRVPGVPRGRGQGTLPSARVLGRSATFCFLQKKRGAHRGATLAKSESAGGVRRSVPDWSDHRARQMPPVSHTRVFPVPTLDAGGQSGTVEAKTWYSKQSTSCEILK